MNEPGIMVTTRPSLALVKYWGKAGGGRNIPATSSLAVTLGDFTTITRIRPLPGGDESEILVDGVQQDFSRYRELFAAFADATATEIPGLRIESVNSFASSAGLASSSSGMAALALGLDALLQTGLSREELSAVARIGSGSAARAVFGGFTQLPRNSLHAEQIVAETHWPELRVIVCTVSQNRKPVSSREAMERARMTSPFYEAWLEDSKQLFRLGREALLSRDLEALGTVARLSYLRMFSTMFSSSPPLIYWYPESLEIIRELEALRAGGIGAWETMDAGPQVKILCLQSAADSICTRLKEKNPALNIRISSTGPDPEIGVWRE